MVVVLLLLTHLVQGKAERTFLEKKVSNSIYKHKISPWAKNPDGTANLTVIFTKDTSFYEAIEIVRRNGGYYIANTEGISIISSNWHQALTIIIDENKVFDLANVNKVKWIDEIPPEPIIYNDGSRNIVSVDKIQTTPYQLDGTDIQTAEWDAYHVDSQHPDLKNRVSFGDVNIIADHATHVAGTMLGNGSVSASQGGSNLQWKGIATNANVKSFEWFNNINELNSEYTSAIVSNSVISQNSWGLGCTEIGEYDIFTQRLDEIIVENKTTIVWAIGNSRDDGNCGTDPSNVDNNYKVVSKYATAKNVISVGAINTNDKSMTIFSGWGPTIDNRTKPDLVAGGCQIGGDGGIKSTTPDAFIDLYNNTNGAPGSDGLDDYNNFYDVMCGTSMAAPAVSGIAALMYQQFKCLKPYNVETPLPSTIKALLIHTATDINNSGPDYASGWGLVNATSAIDYIIYRYFREANLSSSTETDKFNLSINDSNEPLKVTLVWDDPGDEPPYDSPNLVNDLDLYLKAPNGTIFKSWTLDPSNPSAPATKDGNHRDNVEQIYIENPGSDNLYEKEWQIIVNATSCNQCPQKYSLIYKRGFEITFYANISTDFSLPVVPYNKKVSKALAPIQSTTYALSLWNATTQHWKSLGDDDLEPGVGYHIVVDPPGTQESINISIWGTPVVNQGIDIYSTSYPYSWNLIGYNSFINEPVNSSISSLSFGEFYRTDYYYKKGWGVYFSDPNIPSDSFYVVPGKSYWINTSISQTWTNNPQQSCFTTEETPQKGTTIYEGINGSAQFPYFIYGKAECERALNKEDSNINITLKVNGIEVTTYTMGELESNKYRLQVPLGVNVSTNDIAEIYINDVLVNEGNVTIGGEAETYEMNISITATDSDGDSYSAECFDCDDTNSSIHSNATELYNGVDDNCNGIVDEGFYNLNINVQTLKSNYNENAFVNITDPPDNSPPNYLISRDTAWAILKKDYINKYLDFKFVYLNDSYYRVDWEWNDDYVRDILINCTKNEIVDKERCIEDTSINHFIPEALKTKIEPKHKKSLINSSVDKFTEKYFPDKEFSKLTLDVNFLKQNSMPKEIIKGNAEIIGSINPLNEVNGSFYIELKDGFYNSNGLRIKWGLNSTLVEFNNSKTTENLTFTENQNITRYIELPRYSDVISATIKIKGYDNDARKTYSVAGISDFPTVKWEGIDFQDGTFWVTGFTDSLLYEINNNDFSLKKRLLTSDTSAAHDSTNLWRYESTGGYMYEWLNEDSIANNTNPGGPDNSYDVNGFVYDLAYNGTHLLGVSLLQSNYRIITLRASDGAITDNCTLPFTESRGIAWNGTHIIINSYNNYSLYTLNWISNGVCTVKNQITKSISSDLGNIHGLAFNGNNIFYVDQSVHATIYQYYTLYPNDPYLDVANSSGGWEWGYFGEFNTLETTSDFSSELNNALNNGSCNCNGCSLDGDNCVIPFVFHSDTVGLLEYSNVNIVYSTLPEENQSKITNNAPTDASIYLLMKVQYYNSTISTWVNESAIVEETSPRTIEAGKTLKLDTIWNPNAWNTSTNTHGSGIYRVYVAATSENNTILQNYDGTNITDSYNFTLAVPTGDTFKLKNNGEEIAIFDSAGNLFLKNTLTQSTIPTDTIDDEFLLKNNSGTVVAKINSTGYMEIKGTLSQNQGTLTNPPGDDFLIKEDNGNVVARINESGYLFLKGSLYENSIS